MTGEWSVDQNEVETRLRELEERVEQLEEQGEPGIISEDEDTDRKDADG